MSRATCHSHARESHGVGGAMPCFADTADTGVWRGLLPVAGPRSASSRACAAQPADSSRRVRISSSAATSTRSLPRPAARLSRIRSSRPTTCTNRCSRARRSRCHAPGRPSHRSGGRAQDVERPGGGVEREAVPIQDGLHIEHERNVFRPLARPSSELAQHADEQLDIGPRALVADVEVRGRSLVAVDIRGKAADQDVLHAGHI